jgi:hypothetical protein
LFADIVVQAGVLRCFFQHFLFQNTRLGGVFRGDLSARRAA